MSNSLDSIRVAIRVRPLIKRENNCKENWAVDENTIYQIHDGKKVPNTAFTFDRIFSKEHSTIDLYSDFAKPIVLSVMEGINGTLFAYGQTSSGKTYTMSGNENSPGIIPYALQEVFDFISKTQNREFLLRVSYMEIYNEVITDLLQPKSTNLKIRENTNKEILVDKLTEKVVTNVDQIIEVIQIGEKNRHFGGTNMNERSSRSHTIFRMVAESRETHSRASVDGGEFAGAVKVSQLNLVDLAGSERVSQTGAEGLRLREGGFINKSLFALANVINKLSDGESVFVPFRDSKLTRILQNSLGGNTKTSIICAVTPASVDETLSSLQFASRAKTIKNRPEVNEVLDDGTMLKRCRREISDLKLKLEKSHSREELLKREMELQKEKDMIQAELDEQRRVAEETKAKLRELKNVFCTAQPKEKNLEKQRKQRRWTVCPMGANRGPLLQLDLPAAFDAEIGRPAKRLDQTFAGCPSNDVSSVDFSTANHDRFLDDLREEEERKSLETACDFSAVNENRNRLSVNVSEERVAELELEITRITEERDALCEERDSIRKDLSDNITSSCEIQADLLKTKEILKEKKKENRELQEQLQQLEATLSVVDDNRQTVDSHRTSESSFSSVVPETSDEDNELLDSTIIRDLSMLAKLRRASSVVQDLEGKEIIAVEIDKESTEQHDQFVESSTIALGEKDSESERNSEEIRQLRERLAQESARNLQLEEKLATMFDEALREQKPACVQTEQVHHHESPDLKRKHPEAELIAHEEHAKRLKDEQFEAIVEGEPMSEVDSEEENFEVNELKIQLGVALATEERIRLEHSADIADLQEKYEAALTAMAKDLQDKCKEVDRLRRKVKCEMIPTLVENPHAEALEEELCVAKMDLDSALEEVATLKEAAENFVKENGSRNTDVETQFQEEISLLKEKLDAVTSEKENLVKENENRIADVETHFREEIILLKEKLDAVISENENLIKDDENRIAEMETQFQEDISLLKEKLDAVTSEKEYLVKENENCIAVVETLFREEISLLKEKLDAVTSEKENLIKDDENRKADVETQFQEEISLLKEKLDAVTSEKENLVKENENCIADVETHFREEISLLKEKLDAVTSEKENLVKEDKSCDADDVETLFRKEITLLKEKLDAVTSEKENLVIENENCIADVQTQFQEEISLLKEKLDAVTSEKQNLVIENENGIVDQEAQFREEISLLKEKLDAVTSEKENLIKDDENRIAKMEAQFQEEISLLKEKLDAVTSDKENLVIENENGIADAQTQFQEEISLLKEKLDAVTSEKDNLVKENVSCIADVETNFREEIILLKEKLDAVTSEKQNLVIENENGIADRELQFREEISLLNEKLDAVTSEKENLVIENKNGIADLETQFQEEISLLKEKLDVVTSEKENLTKDDENRIAKMETQFQEEISLLKEKLDAVTSDKENLAIENDNGIAEVETQFQQEINVLKEKLDAVTSEKQNLVKENEVRISEVEKQLNIDISLLKEELEATVSAKEDLERNNEARPAEAETEFREEIRSLKEKLDVVTSEKDNLVMENENSIADLETQFQEEISLLKEKLDAVTSEKENLVKENKNRIADVETQFHEEISLLKEKLDAVTSEKENLVKEDENCIADLEIHFQEEISLLKEKVDALTSEKENLVKESEARISEVEKQLNVDISLLKEELEAAVSAKEDLKRNSEARAAEAETQFREEVRLLKENLEGEHQTTAESLQTEFDNQIEEIRQAVLEKERELVRSQEEDVNAVRAELDREREQLRARVNESAAKIHELDTTILEKEIQYEESVVENQKLKEQVERLVCEAKQISHELNLKTNETESLQNDLNSTVEELNRIKDDLRAKSDDVSTLEKNIHDATQAIETLKKDNEETVQQLVQQNDTLKMDLEKLLREHEISKTDPVTHKIEKEVDMSESPETSCKDCRRRSGTSQGRRESDVFKSMLHDIKEQVGKEHVKQDQLIDELNHTLLTTQERLQQKEFELDEKEIEVMEKDELVQTLQEKLETAEQLSVCKESKAVELKTQLKQGTEDIADLRARLKSAEEELCEAKREYEMAIEEAKRESEMAIEKLRHETNALQERVRESVLSEEQLKELYCTMEEKTKKIAELEQELSEVPKKDSKIGELEMEIDILQGNITSLKGRSDGDQESIRELRQMLREQEKHIVQLEACKADLKLERDVAIGGELRDLRVELEGARSRLAEVEEEKIRGIKVMEDETKDLLGEYEANVKLLKQSIQNKDKELRESVGKLERALEDVNEKDASKKQTVQELMKKEAELRKIKTSFETLSDELKRINGELNEQRKNHEEEIQRLESDVQVAEGAFKKAMNDKFETDEIVKEKEVENEALKKQLQEWEEGISVQQLKEDTREAEILRSKVSSLNGELETTLKKLGEKEKMCGKFDAGLQERENELSSLKGKFYDVEVENEALKKQLLEITGETDIFRSKVSSLNSELEKASKKLREKEKMCGKLDAGLQECEDELSTLKDKFYDLEVENKASKKQLGEVEILRSKVSSVNSELEKISKKLRGKEKMCGKLDAGLQECEDELSALKDKFYDLEVENETLKKQLQERDEGTSMQQHEVARLRQVSDQNLEEELEKARSELKEKFHVEFENTKQLNKARIKMRELENDIASYARKNSDLKAEIRSLRNRDYEPTVNMPSSSSNGENVGVVGSVALFTLNARVEKLGDENKALQQKSETFQKEVEKLSFVNLDLKQKHGQLTEKYNRLKLKFVSIVEEQKKGVASKAEQNTGVELQASVQNNDPSLSGEIARSQSAFQDQRREPISVQAEPAFRQSTGNSAFKPSNESAFKKPASLSTDIPASSSIAGKPAGPIPSHQASKPSVGLPRRAEEKQPERKSVMQANNKTTNEFSSFEKAKKAVFSKQNKENLFSTNDKPDACKPQ